MNASCRAGKSAPAESLAARLAAREAERRKLHTRMADRLRREHAAR